MANKTFSTVLMNSRYTDRFQYFCEQYKTSKKFMVPYIQSAFQIKRGMRVAEIGCGEGGNLLPFVELGCQVVGIDLATRTIHNANDFFQQVAPEASYRFVNGDIFTIEPPIHKFDVIILRDTLEHIHDHIGLLHHLKNFLSQRGVIFFAFPPWQMPFGGHQQMCKNPILRRLPYIHLIPRNLFGRLLRLFGEEETRIASLLDIRQTRITPAAFRAMTGATELEIIKDTYFLINPNYKTKFSLPPIRIAKFLVAPYVTNFVCTTYYCLCKVTQENAAISKAKVSDAKFAIS